VLQHYVRRYKNIHLILEIKQKSKLKEHISDESFEINTVDLSSIDDLISRLKLDKEISPAARVHEVTTRAKDRLKTFNEKTTKIRRI
jgi:hypothetical protein